MSALDIVQIVSALGTILTAFVLPIVLSRMSAAKDAALAANQAAIKAADEAKKSTIITEKAAETTAIIHNQTNGNLSKLGARVEELQGLVLRFAERSSLLVNVPLGVEDQARVDALRGVVHAAPTTTTVQQVGDAIKTQVADGLSETLKDLKVETIITDTINVKKVDAPEP